jgi:hypothetical protein
VNVEKNSRVAFRLAARLATLVSYRILRRFRHSQVTALLSAATMQLLESLLVSLCAQQQCSAGIAAAQSDINNVFLLFSLRDF